MRRDFFNENRMVLFLVAVAELVDTTGRVDELHLTGIERMRHVADLQLYQRILIAVGPLDGVFRLDRRTGQKSVVAGNVLEYDHSIVLGVDLFLHGYSKLVGKDTSFFQETKYFA